MPLSFSSFHKGPLKGERPKSLVVLLHGYGDRGEHFLALSHHWTSLLPTTLFMAPDGPSVCEEHPQGRQWFSLRDWDSSRILKDIHSLIPNINQYLDSLLKQYQVPARQMALVGFSQGAMLSLEIALSRPAFAGVLAYGGALFEDPHDKEVTQTPILLIHGMEDQVVPPSSSEKAERTLKSLGAPVSLSLFPHLDHTIDERGLELGGAFLKNVLRED